MNRSVAMRGSWLGRMLVRRLLVARRHGRFTGQFDLHPFQTIHRLPGLPHSVLQGLAGILMPPQRRAGIVGGCKQYQFEIGQFRLLGGGQMQGMGHGRQDPGDDGPGNRPGWCDQPG